MKRLKYVGEFRDLVPMGFRFQKLYAGNHRCYHTYQVEGANSSYTLWVWEKGRDIEVEDWYGLLVPILEFIEGKEFPGRVLNADGKYPIVIEDGDVTLLCNRETLKVEEVLVGVNDFFAMFVKMQTGKITEAEYKEYVRVHREININVFDLLDELGSLKGMYEVVEE